ncbi:MAG TPA: FAD-dependent oxidoreductase [Streptosporangiaceae bacterium]|nr:FAD-dependent oxidoreductase [Streptosporangiaceae bacterium]
MELLGSGRERAAGRGDRVPAEPRFVIIGASLAGAKAAETLRGEGFGGAVVLIGAEQERPYERPPLSKGLLLGKDDKGTIYVHEESWYDQHDVDLRRGVAAVAVDRGAHQISLADGEVIGYDKLLITTGAAPRRLNVPGGDLDGVLYLRSVSDSERLADAFRSTGQAGGRVVIAGGGWIGLETAAAARSYGCEVTVVEPEPTPLNRVLGTELGEVFASLHRRHGVEFMLRTGVAEFRGGADAGRVRTVVTTDGAELAADVVVVGIGAVPNVSLAEAAGLDVGNGIVTDAGLRSSDPDIYAAGDVANSWHPLLDRRVRVEHWANALHGGPAAARSMLGQDVSYDRVPYFYSDQYELSMETSGLPEDYDAVVYRGEPESGEFIAFWLAAGRVLAGMNVNVWDVTGEIQALVRSGTRVDPVRLADPGVPLSALAMPA